jgi:UDP-N-acetylmuramoyl-L-alanyl-D-glutamate--2,6-diaminopimelate ligase
LDGSVRQKGGTRKNMKKYIPQKLKNIYHLGQSVLANLMYKFPSKNITIIGVTGTNGKTTTVQMIGRILEEAGHKVAVASTINFKIGEKEWINKTKFTTLSSFSVQKFIRQSVDAGCRYIVLETSSHALDQKRVWGVKYKTAVITNVTREHLDYHHNMEEYRITKLKLFENIEVAVVNLDMINANDYLDCGNKIKYGFTTREDLEIKNNDYGKIEVVKSRGVSLGINYSNFMVENEEFNLKLPGLFNVENALAAISVGLSENIELSTMKTALEKITGISGRMEHVPNEKNIDIIVDYAVTPDSLEKMYNLISLIKRGAKRKIGSTFETVPKIIAVLGSCGERDRGKRPMLGEIADKNADYVIVTNEDPYGEDPDQIINEVAGGIKDKKENVEFWRISDRREAIKKALALAGPGDIVVVTGKGAEETMAIGSKKIPWNDKKVIQEILQERV